MPSSVLEPRNKVIQALKSWIINFQRLALHQDRIEFCQQFNGAMKNSLTVSHTTSLGGLQHWLIFSFHTIIHHSFKTTFKLCVRTWKDLQRLERAWKYLEGLERTWNYLEGLERTWKNLDGHERTWKDLLGKGLKVLGGTWKDLKGIERTWRDLKLLEITWKVMNRLERTWEDLKWL